MQGLALSLADPELATRSCDDCKKWLYLLDGPKRGTVATRGGEKVSRGKTKPPCWQCPKKSPEQAGQFELKYRNAKTVELFWQSKNSSIPSDSILKRNLAIVARIVDQHEKHSQRRNTSELLTALVSPR